MLLESRILSAKSTLLQCSIRGLASQAAHTSTQNTGNGVNSQNREDSPADQGRRNDRPRRMQASAALNQVKSTMTNELRNNQPIQKVYTQFQAELQDLVSHKGVNPRNFMNSSICNSVLTKLIEQSRLELEAQSIGDSASIPPTPFEILQTYLKYNLARHQHFLIVMKEFLAENKPKEAINLWISYLEHSRQFPINKAGQSQIEALTSIAYLMICRESNAKPDVKVLSQLLSTSSEKIPYSTVQQEVSSQKAESADNSSDLVKLFEQLLLDFMVTNKKEFIETFLQNSNDLRLINYFYNMYLKIAVEDFTSSTSPDVPSAFMIRFAELNRANDAVKVISQLKQASPDFKPSPAIHNALLKVVAYMPTNDRGKGQRSEKLQRIQAVWNSCIKVNEVISADSYKAMLEALIIAGSFKTVQQFWDMDIPAELKNKTLLSDTYLIYYFTVNRNTPYASLKGKIPKDVHHNLELANKILLALIHSKAPFSEIETFYSETFQSTGGVKPNNTSLAAKLLANINALEDTQKDTANIMSTIGLASHSENLIPVIEEYLNICAEEQRPAEALLTALRIDYTSRESAQKVSKFIDYFLKHGNLKRAEEIFKECVVSNLNSPVRVGPRIFNSMFHGLSEMGISRRDASFLSKEQVYWELCEKIHKKVFNESVISTVKTFSILSGKNTEFNTSEINFANHVVLPYLVRLKIEEGFTLRNPKLLKNLKANSSIQIPPELL